MVAGSNPVAPTFVQNEQKIVSAFFIGVGMLFLLSNDDGFRAFGLRMLREILLELGDVVVVAPEEERSAASHSLTISRPLDVRKTGDGIYAVDGTPTDCIMMAVNGLLEERPDFVISGINHGANLGDDVTYSGTVAAAIEGTLLGIPSLAISYASRDSKFIHLWGKKLLMLLDQLIRKDLPTDTLLNINIPPINPDDTAGVKITTLGRRLYQDPIQIEKEDDERFSFTIGGQGPRWKGANSCDFKAVDEGFISITPIHLDLTNYDVIDELNAWRLEVEQS
ncbi:MAG: 5'/3'-nucleotidase SurE [Candidatus Glassbacteria bacterium]